MKRGQSIRYYSKNEIVKLAKETGYQLHLQYFSDLNYYLHDHRLNRYSVNVTEGPFTYPIRPIIASVSEDGDKFTLGYIYEKDGQERILIEPDEEAALTDESRKGCSGWKLLGFLFPPILLIQFLVKFFKAEQERMRG